MTLLAVVVFWVLVGLVIVNVIRPGVGADLSAAGGEVPELETPSSPVELLLDVVPENVVAEAAAGNMLAIIFFSVLFGLAAASLPDRRGRWYTSSPQSRDPESGCPSTR